MNQYLVFDDILRQYCVDIASTLGVCSIIHEEDLIFKFVLEHPCFSQRTRSAVEYYFNDGSNSAKKLYQLIQDNLNIDRDKRYRLLEFASGFGCVTRHLKKHFPDFEVIACDIHEAAIDFIVNTVRTKAILSKKSPEDFFQQESFDVVFALSFFSHMPEHTWGRWLKSLFNAVSDDGLLIFTCHGKDSRKYIGNPVIPDSGFYFKHSSEQTDLSSEEYGTTLTHKKFVLNEIEKQTGDSLVCFKQGNWWQHQDIYILKKSTTSD